MWHWNYILFTHQNNLSARCAPIPTLSLLHCNNTSVECVKIFKAGMKKKISENFIYLRNQIYKENG